MGLSPLFHASSSSLNDHTDSHVALLSNHSEEALSTSGRVGGSTDKVEINESPTVPNLYFEICKPAPLAGISEIIIRKKAYIVSYNKNTRCPNWVAWHLTGEHTDGPTKRINRFYADNAVPAPRATNEDYKGSGWSRGHMCPAGDNKWDEKAMEQSFSLIKVCPKNASLNSGLWNSIEIGCRIWAKKHQDIYCMRAYTLQAGTCNNWE